MRKTHKFDTSPGRKTMQKRRNISGEEARLKYVLSCIHGDIVEGTLPPTGEKRRLEFIEHYSKVAVGRKYVDGYTKSVLITMKYDVDEPHSDDLFWGAEGVIEEDFYYWLLIKDPEIWLGGLCGKHSDISKNFCKLSVEKTDDYFRVEAKNHHMPGCLRELHDEWKQEKEEDEARAENEFGKESPEKRSRTEKRECEGKEA